MSAVEAGQLQDKVVVVAGAGTSLGRVAALRAAREGARVAVVSADAAGAETAQMIGPGARFFHATGSGVKQVIEQVVAAFGQLDALVNVVQPATPWQPFTEKGEAGFAPALDGLRTALAAMHAAYPFLKMRGGRVVNVGSVYGSTAFAHVSDSITSDYALQGLTRAIGVEWARDNVLVNYLGPAALDLPQFRHWREPRAATVDKLVHGLALQRLGDPDEDFGGALMFLLSDEACFLVGHSVYADGGQHLVAPVFEPGAGS